MTKSFEAVLMATLLRQERATWDRERSGEGVTGTNESRGTKAADLPTFVAQGGVLPCGRRIALTASRDPFDRSSRAGFGWLDRLGQVAVSRDHALGPLVRIPETADDDRVSGVISLRFGGLLSPESVVHRARLRRISPLRRLACCNPLQKLQFSHIGGGRTTWATSLQRTGLR